MERKKPSNRIWAAQDITFFLRSTYNNVPILQRYQRYKRDLRYSERSFWTFSEEKVTQRFLLEVRQWGWAGLLDIRKDPGCCLLGEYLQLSNAWSSEIPMRDPVAIQKPRLKAHFGPEKPIGFGTHSRQVYSVQIVLGFTGMFWAKFSVRVEGWVLWSNGPEDDKKPFGFLWANLLNLEIRLNGTLCQWSQGELEIISEKSLTINLFADSVKVFIFDRTEVTVQ